MGAGPRTVVPGAGPLAIIVLRLLVITGGVVRTGVFGGTGRVLRGASRVLMGTIDPLGVLVAAGDPLGVRLRTSEPVGRLTGTGDPLRVRRRTSGVLGVLLRAGRPLRVPMRA